MSTENIKTGDYMEIKELAKKTLDTDFRTAPLEKMLFGEKLAEASLKREEEFIKLHKAKDILLFNLKLLEDSTLYTGLEVQGIAHTAIQQFENIINKDMKE